MIFRWLCTFFLLLLLAGIAEAQPYVIEHYHVDMTLQLNGRLDVVETIDVNFNEGRRGIIRSIPYRYRVDRTIKGEKAIRSQTGAYYLTSVKDINVEGHTFVDYKSGDYVMVRIGDADKTLKGPVQYVISYSIWGTLNAFDNRVEWPFNIIGHDWDAPIEDATFQVNFPQSLQLKPADYLTYTGHIGSRDENVQLSVSNTTFSGQLTKSLKPYQGITVAIQFPKDYFDQTQVPIGEFADKYWIDSTFIHYTINPEGAVDVEEVYVVRYVGDLYLIEKVIRRNVFDRWSHQFLYNTSFGARAPNPDRDFKLRYHRQADEDWLRLSNASKRGEELAVFSLNYRIWGSLKQDHNTPGRYEIRLPLTILNGKEPVRQLKGRISSSISNSQLTIGSNLPLNTTRNKANDKVEWALNSPALFGVDGVLDGVIEVDEPLDLSQVPNNIYAKNYYIEQNRIQLQLADDGKVTIDHALDITFNTMYMYPTFFWNVPGVQKNIEANAEDDILFPKYRLFSKKNRLNIIDFNYDEEVSSIVNSDRLNRQLTLKEIKGQDGYGRFLNFSYSTYKLLKNYGRYYRLQVPIASNLSEPVFRTIVEIDPSWIDSNHPVFAVDGNGHQIDGFEWNEETGTAIISGRIPVGQSAYLSVPISSSLIQLRWGHHIVNFVESNIFLMLSLLVLIFFLFIYFLFGRDKTPIVTASYYPPKGVTPAEIGWLDDDRIQNRDLISLIYYWASKGIIEIEEINPDLKKHLEKQQLIDEDDEINYPKRLLKKSDFKLTKLSNLPPDSKPFEKTMFQGLFKSKQSVTISSLKTKFHTTLRKTRKELENYGKQRSFYVPGTRAFGSCLMILAVILLFVGLVAFGAGFLMKDHTYAIGLAILGLSLYFIGKYMPKKGRYGFKKYEKMLGFKTFIELAEIDRLKRLIDDNPSYFSDTLPYAMAFGLVDEWSEKFEQLIFKPPDWYKSPYPGHRFTPLYFAQSMDNSISAISKDLSSRPVSTSSGSGGSSFGGGFSSGGGFGGGGGSSW